MLTHIFNFSTQVAEPGRSLSLRPVWSTDGVPGQSGLHRKTQSQKQQQQQRRQQQQKQHYDLWTESQVLKVTQSNDDCL